MLFSSVVSAWRKELQKASFRGVEFDVAARDLAGGRRIVQHVYPKRDEPNPEDMGRKHNTINVQAYQFGSGYLGPRNQLREALNKEGIGEYIDPWGDVHQVTVPDWSSSENQKEGGYVTFRITFWEAGEQKAHKVQPDTAGTVTTLADKLSASAIITFAREWLPIIGNAPALLGRVVSNIASALGISSIISYAAQIMQAPQMLMAAVLQTIGIKNWVAFGLSSLVSLVLSPLSIGKLLLGLIGGNSVSRPSLQSNNMASAGGSYAQNSTRISALTALADAALSGSLSSSGFSGSFSGITPTRQDAHNSTAINTLVAKEALAEAAKLVATTNFATANEAKEVGLTLCKQLGQLLPIVDNAEYQTVTALRAAVLRDVTVRGARLPELTEVTPIATQPALVQAYTIYGTAAKEQELLTRNPHIYNPCFVPGSNSLTIVRGK